MKNNDIIIIIMFPLVHSSSRVTLLLCPSPLTLVAERQGVGLYDTYNKIQENQTKPQK